MNSPPQIYCMVRKKWVDRTPEEEIRQHMVKYLNITRYIPLHLMVCEYPIDYLKHRADLVIHDRKGKPLLLAEFKAPSVVINHTVIAQIRRYNQQVQAPYLVISNGDTTLFWKYSQDKESYEPMRDIPPYEDLLKALAMKALLTPEIFKIVSQQAGE